MTAAQIIRHLSLDRYRRNFVLPHYTPFHWWECDLFELTPAGSFREYEVKISRGDFFADAKKDMWSTESRRVPFDPHVHASPPLVVKHELLARRDARCPQFFWFVTPEGLVEEHEVPDWAGLITFKGDGYRACERIVRKAPRLNSLRISPAVELHARGVCYWRMHHMMTADRMEAIAKADTEVFSDA